MKKPVKNTEVKMVRCIVCGTKYPAHYKCGCPSCAQQMGKK